MRQPHCTIISKQGGARAGPGATGPPGLRNCDFPHFHPGNRGKCFHPLQKIGPLDRRQSSSHLSHNGPGGGSHGNRTVAREPEGNCDLPRGEEGWGAHGWVGLAPPARPAADSPSCSPPVNHSPASYHSGFLFSVSALLAFPVGDPVRPSSVPFRKQDENPLGSVFQPILGDRFQGRLAEQCHMRLWTRATSWIPPAGSDGFFSPTVSPGRGL